MATFTQTGPADLNTAVPQVRTVEPKVSNTANMISTIGAAGIELYKEDVRKDAKRSSEAVIGQLNQDLQNIDDSVDLSDQISSQLSEFAENNPHIQDLKKTLGGLKTAEQQRKGAKLLYTLRAESELKRVLARAPGLRKEVTKIAANTLGVDPTAATISAILRGLEPKDTSKDKDYVYEEFKRVDQQRQQLGMQSATYIHGQTGLSDVIKMREEANLVESATAKRTELATRIQNGEQVTPELISEFGAQVGVGITAQTNELIPTISNVLRSIETDEQFTEFSPVILSQLDAFEASFTQALNATYAPVMVDSKNLDMWTKQKQENERLVKDTISQLRTMASDRTMLQNRLRGVQVLTDQYKMDFLTSNNLLARLEVSVPGLSRDLFTSFNVQNLEDRERITGAIRDAVRGMPADEVKKLDLASMVDVVTGDRNLDDLDADQRERLSKKSLNTVREFDKNYKGTPDMYTSGDLEGAAKAYATVLSMQGKYNTNDWAEVANLTSSPAFAAVVKNLQDNGDQFTAEILADSAVKATGKAANGSINDTFKRYLHNNVGPEWAGNKASVVFDADSGKFTLNQFRVPTHGPLRSSAVEANSNLKLGVDKLNLMVSNLMDNGLTKHDPSLAGLDRSQLAYVLSQRLMQDNGIQMVGELKPMPKQQTPETREIKFENVARQTIDTFEKTIQRMQTQGLATEENQAVLGDLMKQLEELRGLRQQDTELARVIAELSTR